MSFYIVRRPYDGTSTSYYTGLDDLDLLYSTNISDAEMFETTDVCFLTYEALRAKMTEEDNSNYYIFIDSTGVNE